MFGLNKYNNRWSLILILGLIHGIVASWQYPPFFTRETWLAGYSIFLIVSLFLFFWTFSFAVLIALFLSGRWQMTQAVFLSGTRVRDAAVIILSIVLVSSICLWIVYGLSSLTPDSQIDDYIKIAGPILNLFTFFSLEFLIVIVFEDAIKQAGLYSKYFSKLVFALLLLGVLFIIVHYTGLGIVPSYIGDWSVGIPAVPLFEWHIIIASCFLILMILSEVKGKILDFAHLDLLICIMIWLGASVIWISQPVVPNASALKPHEPNFEIYPFIDSQTYDQLAQSVLVGKGFNNSIPPRSLYITFLVIAHVLVGQDYDAMIVFQSLVFALFPVLLYVFCRRFFGRPIGVSIALLAIFRDFTSNLVSPFTGNLSYSKVFLSEIPTAMFLVLVLILGFRWIKEEFPFYVSMLIGATLGLVMLIRTQSVIALPVLILFGFLIHPRKLKPLITSSIVAVISILLVITPWLWRNWELTGDIIFDSPEFQIINLALRYNRLNGIEPNVMPLPNETYAESNERLKQMAIDAIRSNPQKAMWGVANTFLNHGINNLLLMPLRYELKGMGDFWVPEYAFWERWDGKPSTLQSLLLLFYAFLFALGVTTAWHRNGWMGLLPLGLNLAYNFWTSLALLSGQRFMMAMDWSIYFYYMIGIFSLLGGFFLLLSRGRPIILGWWNQNKMTDMQSSLPKRPTLANYALVLSLFIFMGSLPPLVEKIFPERYPLRTDEQILPELLKSPSLEQSLGMACLQKLDREGMLSYIQGRALYPRYYFAKDGERFTDATGYKVVDEDRMVFEFVGQMNDRIIFPMSTPPDFFPHVSDVTLIYGRNSNLWFIDVRQGVMERFYVSKEFDYSLCN